MDGNLLKFQGNKFLPFVYLYLALKLFFDDKRLGGFLKFASGKTCFCLPPWDNLETLKISLFAKRGEMLIFVSPISSDKFKFCTNCRSKQVGATDIY